MKYVVGILVLLVIVGAGYFSYTNNGSQEEQVRAGETQNSSVSITEESEPAAGFLPASTQPANDTTPTKALKPARTPPAGYREFRSEKYRFALLYPTELSVKTYDEGNNASTITFINADRSQNFQIFVVPYGERQVSAARFKMDEPSGVINQPTQIVLNNSPATMFFGSNAVMGETREVWFIKNGYLYEVTTYKDLDNWISQIMQTWIFL